MSTPRLNVAKRRLGAPILAAIFFGVLVVLFHAVLLPFIMALIIVYLMEPMVRRLCGVSIKGRRLPRWGAVVSVYLSIFTFLTLFALIFVPPLTLQVGAAAEEIPDYFTEVREKYLPRWSAQIEDLLGMSPSEPDARPEDVKVAVKEAKAGVANAVRQAASVQDIDVLPVVDLGGGQPLLITDGDRLPLTAKQTSDAVNPLENLFGAEPRIDRSRVAFSLIPDPETGGFAVVASRSNLRVAPMDDGTYLVSLEPEHQSDEAGFNLEREIVKGLSGLVESGSEYAGDLLSLVQTLLEVIVGAFIMIILMLMVAAFMSIDLPRIMDFVRSLVPPRGHAGYDELLSRLNKGLSGVIRGQLVICTINGTLTGIGLWALDVDFALMLAIIAGVLSLIPVFGTIISTIPAVLIALTQGASTAFLVLAWILIVHFIDANFFTPKIVGSSSELHPVTIIFALLAGEASFGLVGALLAVPVASIVQTFFLFFLSRARQRDREESPTNPGQVAPDKTIAPMTATTPAPEA